MEQSAWIGHFLIESRNKKTGKVTTELVKNRIMNASLNELADVLCGVTPDLTIAYLALGTGDTAVTDSDTQLANEIFRTEPTVDPVRVSTGQVETTFVVLDTEAVGTIKEIGIFVGSTATASANTGVLLSRVLWTKVKSSSEELTIKRIDKIVRA